ncbi:MAG: imidazolonepropionase-like amidohydrolase [Limisphaerales bacterium]|jgi:imidazolonepropionase-like amidohydrolase
MTNALFKSTRYLLSMLAILLTSALIAQGSFPVNGAWDSRTGLHAFTNATITTSPGNTIENATLLIRDGKIEAVASNVSVPKEAVVHDCTGEYIYPSFIDIFSTSGIAEKQEREREEEYEQLNSERDGAWGWNEALMPEFSAASNYKINSESNAAMRKAGFGAVVTHRRDGISRGTGAAILLTDESENNAILKEDVASFLSFRKGTSTQEYPSSLMGAIALLRQTYLDGQWYTKQDKEFNLSLEAWNEIQSLPQVFEVQNHLSILRADKLGDEFGKNYIIKSNGSEYRRIDAIKAAGNSLIVPLNFPEAYAVSDPFDAELVSYVEMKHWEMAPHNAGLLSEAGIEFALTTHGLESPAEFMDAIHKAIEHGLGWEAAMASLTTIPARLLKLDGQLGTLEAGKTANFLRMSNELFHKEATIYENWVNGHRHSFNNPDATDYSGNYELKVGTKTWTLEIDGDAGSHGYTLKKDTLELKATIKADGDMLAIAFEDDIEKWRLSGWAFGNEFKGKGQDVSGNWISWSAKKTAEAEAEVEEESETAEELPAAGDMVYPFQAYGWLNAPAQEHVVFRNATVWTNGSDGILENTDVMVKDGKITRIGNDLAAVGAREIDATGKHLTSGIIDEHSHIAISSGVNEGTQASSAEVRIGDVINSEDVNIYRQLGGGVTAAQLLHGSANPIGGQSAIIKLRWGSLPEEMKFEGADGFIKFALGENVKQSNWGNDYRVRFPQTRMGVEQVYFDAFTRAQEYGVQKAAGDPNLRTDLDLEALLEIVNSERFITCHSYVQSEINMLMKTAEAFGFRINTFTHILEGYKVADKMAEHGAGGSTFADWWAYKYEVIDAIPYNAAIMNEMGVTVALNSDDAEMARRLNQQAAKAVKYGGASQEDAWKMVTLNPAKLLHIDDRVGSVEKGKDADIVLWSANPLSMYSRAESTWIDGKEYFNLAKDEAMRKTISEERHRLVSEMLDEGGSGSGENDPSGENKHLNHCDDLMDYSAGNDELIIESSNHNH